ncbi:FtsX-like permease family protein [Streptomyces sioyaensis]|uniref:FtsX-like permease family protein n=1 Tax=Streptomyces sioyaensis TaxID=67364 RepID=A0A4Q1QQU9_9ACTN|nr:FtsX-like permease family protein [Streptomyces sioyaensis]MBM4791273.1 FtsX-like permease family protein [Streptomyces sioyaensis]RXS58006.1 FtsX-like permease family protein [Streptomyces sioyaensis]
MKSLTRTDWLRARLRATRAAALALGALVLVTAFLAAAFPRGVEAYETQGVRHALGSVPPAQRTVEITVSRADLTGGDPAAAYAGPELARQDRAIRGQFAAPLRIAGGDAVHGVRTTKAPAARDSWLPRPDGLAPLFSLYAASGLDRQAAVTVATARTLRLHLGSRLHLDGLTVRICGLLAPRAPRGAYWTVDPLMATARQDVSPGPPPQRYWRAGLLLSPRDGPALPAAGEPEKFWRYPLDPGALTARDAPLLRDRVVSLEHGAALARLRTVAGAGALADSPVDGLLDSFARTRAAIAPVIAVAACGIGTVASVVLLMTASLAAARRHAELALLRARGASLAGLTGHLAAETAAVALPAAAAGGGLALLVPGERVLPSLLAAAATGLLGTLALPLRAAVAHRRPRPAERTDLVRARPSRRRTVAELTVLVLAVGAVLALRRRSTAAGGVDALVSAAPVLIAAIAALLLIRLYPLPLRLAARPAARTTGLTGFLALARAGRAPATAGLPLLALVVALTTASFGGSVLAGVATARDHAALTAVGAEARISAGRALPEALRRAVGKVPGVADAVPVRISIQAADDSGPPLYLVIADAEAYARLARATGLGAFNARELADPGGDRPLPALVSPSFVTRFGRAPMALQPEFGQLVIRPQVVRGDTPAQPGGDFVLLNSRSVARLHPDTYADPANGPSLLLLSGHALDAGALRTAVRTHTPPSLPTRLTLRSAARAELADSPLQQGAERLYTAAVVAGAGFALLALLLSLLQAAPQRTQLLARLRTMGLTPAQGRRLLVLEALPQALLAALGGALVGATAIRLLGPGMDLTPLALPGTPEGGARGTVRIPSDPASLLLPSAGVLALALAVVLAQAWLSGRRRESTELRAGDPR